MQLSDSYLLTYQLNKKREAERKAQLLTYGLCLHDLKEFFFYEETRENEYWS